MNFVLLRVSGRADLPVPPVIGRGWWSLAIVPRRRQVPGPRWHRDLGTGLTGAPRCCAIGVSRSLASDVRAAGRYAVRDRDRLRDAQSALRHAPIHRELIAGDPPAGGDSGYLIDWHRANRASAGPFYDPQVRTAVDHDMFLHSESVHDPGVVDDDPGPGLRYDAGADSRSQEITRRHEDERAGHRRAERHAHGEPG